MAQLPEILEWFSLTAMANNMKAPQSFIKNLLFGNVRSYSTENIVYAVLSGGREVAPFVQKNGEAIMAGGYTEAEKTVSPANIRIKRPLEAADLIFRRHAGDVVFADGADVQQAAAREVARQMQRLEDLVSNAEEYLCAQAIRGVISYTAADESVFTITLEKSGGNTITLTDFWDQTGDVAETIMTARKRMHRQVSLQPTDIILGEEAATAFIKSSSVKELLDLRNTAFGMLDLTNGIGASGPLQGAMPLGSVGGIRVWAYFPSVTLPDGTDYPLVRTKYAEFVHNGPMAMNEMAYGAISDLDALDGGLLSGRRFSKSWRLPDPSVQQVLIASRPLPIMKRPDSVVSVKVVSG